MKNAKTAVTSVEEAVKLGADAVSIHVKLGAETENELCRDCRRFESEF